MVEIRTKYNNGQLQKFTHSLDFESLKSQLVRYLLKQINYIKRLTGIFLIY